MVCEKHNIELYNFWSQLKGGVTFGCSKCEFEALDSKLTKEGLTYEELQQHRKLKYES